MKRQIWMLSLVISLLLAACNPQSQVAAVPDEVLLRLSWVNQSQFSGFYVADQQGFYKDENLAVRIGPGGLGVNAIDKVVTKEDEFGLTGPIQVLQARSEGKPIVAVAAMFQKDPNVWISLAEDNITTPQDMAGRRVGVKLSTEAPYRMLLAAVGVDAAGINEIPLNEFTIRPLIEDDVDVLPGFALNEPLAAREQGYEINIMSLAEQGVFIPAQILIVHEDLLQQNPDIIERFLKASFKGWNVVINDPDAGVKATLRVDETLDATHQANMMEATLDLISPATASVGYMDKEIWQQTMQLVLDQGLIPAPVDLDKLYTAQFLQ